MNNKDKSMRRAASYVAWYKIKGRHPSRVSESPEERRLAAWLGRYKQYVNETAPECHAYKEVTEYLISNIGRHALMNRRKRCLEYAKKYVDYCVKNGSRPTFKNSSTALADELSAWYYNYRKSLRPNSRMAEYPEVTKYVTDKLGADAFTTSALGINV